MPKLFSLQWFNEIKKYALHSNIQQCDKSRTTRSIVDDSQNVQIEQQISIFFFFCVQKNKLKRNDPMTSIFT